MEFATPLTKLLKIKLPIMVAGMGGTTGPELTAAVSNAGGIGTLGAIGLSPDGLRSTIRATRALMRPGMPMGVDLLFPKVGKGARATNKDYTGGLLGAFVDVMCEEKVELFVCAVGVPPKWAVDKLHANGVVVMNMVGSPRHVKHCLRVGVDIVCAQGTEAGAHTGDIATMVLLPQCVDLCKGTDTLVVGAGGIVNGRGVLAALALGADGVWCGSRFLVSPEANAPDDYKNQIIAATSDDTMRTEIYTGRPLRILKNAYAKEWAGPRSQEAQELLKSGVVPMYADMKSGRVPANRSAIPSMGAQWKDNRGNKGRLPDMSGVAVGQAAGALTKIQPAGEIVADLIAELGVAFKSLVARGPQFKRMLAASL